jgi:hypothetical protein
VCWYPICHSPTPMRRQFWYRWRPFDVGTMRPSYATKPRLPWGERCGLVCQPSAGLGRHGTAAFGDMVGAGCLYGTFD